MGFEDAGHTLKLGGAGDRGDSPRPKRQEQVADTATVAVAEFRRAAEVDVERRPRDVESERQSVVLGDLAARVAHCELADHEAAVSTCEELHVEVTAVDSEM